jgi:hypothetical protein
VRVVIPYYLENSNPNCLHVFNTDAIFSNIFDQQLVGPASAEPVHTKG